MTTGTATAAAATSTIGPAPAPRPGGDADIARVAALFADGSRASVLMALADGRALPASVLAAEAGVSPAATSAHLKKLLAERLLTVERSGRHRYYALAGPQVAAALEALAAIAPTKPVTSLRQGTRAQRLRYARTCYDHLAGRLGVAVTAALVDRGALVATDGDRRTVRRPGDRLSAPLTSHPYRLGPHAGTVLAGLGVDLTAISGTPGTARPLLRFCLDWTEQRHHLAGRLGAAVATAFLDAGWVVSRPRTRDLRVTDTGVSALDDLLGIRPDLPVSSG
jgi:DNA-binding transcriptional ArsR family regulator